MHRFVLSTAAEADAPAKYGSPPLKPFQPSHSSPAPTATIGDVVRRVDLAVSLQSRADHRRGDEPRDAGREVDHVTAGVVDRAVVGEEAAAPDQNALTV